MVQLLGTLDVLLEDWSSSPSILMVVQNGLELIPHNRMPLSSLSASGIHRQTYMQGNPK